MELTDPIDDLSEDECAQVRMIDDEIHRLLDAISALRQRRNTVRCKIWRLPPEILLKIFKHLSLIQSPRSDTNRWYAVTHVCRFWREVALSSPSLWTRIDTSRPLQEAREFLMRSKAAPLDVAITTYGRGTLPFGIVDDILGNFEKIRGLEIKHPGDAGLPMSKSLVWGKEWKALKEVSLMQVPVPLALSWLAGLTHLTLEGLEDPPNVSEFLDILAKNPQLEHLTLRDAGPCLGPDNRMVQPYVHMECLKELFILRSDAEPWAQALSHLALPALGRWDINCIDDIADGSIFVRPPDTNLFPYCQRTTMAFDSAETRVSAAVSKTATSAEHVKQDLGICKPMHIGFNRMFSEVTRLISNTWSRTTTLCVGINRMAIQRAPQDAALWNVHTASWCALFAALPQLESLVFENDSHNRDACTTAISLAAALGTLQGDSSLLCPSLRDLTLVHVDFSNQALASEAWIDTLSRRHKRGAPLERLKLRVHYGSHGGGLSDLSTFDQWVIDVQLEVDSTPWWF